MSDLDHPLEAASMAGVTPPRARPIYRILAAVAALFFLGAGVFSLCEQAFAGKPSSLITGIVYFVAIVAVLIQVAVTGRAGLMQAWKSGLFAFFGIGTAASSVEMLLDGHFALAAYYLFASCCCGYFVVFFRRQKHTANSA